MTRSSSQCEAGSRAGSNTTMMFATRMQHCFQVESTATRDTVHNRSEATETISREGRH
jgi:hypothetical protein